MRALESQPHVSTLGVSVEAVKEQLLLLGHTIPDDVIRAFLDEGLRGVGVSNAPLHSVPEAHTASSAKTDSHAGQVPSPVALEGDSRALQEPESLRGAASAATVAQNVGVTCCTPASAAQRSKVAEDTKALRALAPEPCLAASSSLYQHAAPVSGLQNTAAPAAKRSDAAHPSLVGLSSARQFAPGSSGAAASLGAAAMTNSAHGCAAPVRPVGYTGSVVPDQAFAARLSSGEAPNWRQLISRPLYPERLPAAVASQDAVSSARDLAHAAACQQNCASAEPGLSCPHCSASLREGLSSHNGIAPMKGRAWAADLYEGLPGTQTAVLLGPDVLSSIPAAPGDSIGATAVDAQAAGTAQGLLQHAQRNTTAFLRNDMPSQQSLTEQPAHPPSGKENAKQQAEKQAKTRQVPGRLQTRASQQRSESRPAGARCNEPPPDGSPRSTRTSKSSTPRMGFEGPKRLDRVARFRQMQAIWAGDAFLKNGAAGANKAGKRKKLGFCKAFADVHAANERMHNLFVEWSAANG